MNIRPAAELDRAEIIDLCISAFADEGKNRRKTCGQPAH